MKSSIKAIIIACVVLLLGGALTFVVIHGLKQRPEQVIENNVNIDDYLEFKLVEDGSGYAVSLRSHKHEACSVCQKCIVTNCDGAEEDKCAGHDGHVHQFSEEGMCQCGIKELTMKDKPVDVPIDLVIPSTYNNKPVVKIEKLQNTQGVEQLVIPESVTEIAKGAINGTSSLKLIELPFVGQNAEAKTDFNSIFSGAPTELTVVISGGTKVKTNAFSGLEYIKEVQLPHTIEIIDRNAFLNVKNMTTLTIADSEKEPSKLTEIGADAFNGCAKLTNVTFPNSLIKLGKSAFKGCTSLTNMTFPSAITVLPESLFEGCTALEIVSLKSTVEEIAKFAFKGCTALTQMKLPEKFKTIGEGAFYGCSAIKEIEIPSGVEVISKDAFNGCSHLNFVTLSEGLLTIEESAFAGCGRLSKCDLPTTLQSIETLAFANCDKLTTLTINASLQNMAADSFIGCDSLTTIEVVESDLFSEVEGLLMDKEGTKLLLFPNGLVPADGKVVVPSFVTAIGEHAFDGSTSLLELVVGESVLEIGESAFANCANLEVITLHYIGKVADTTEKETDLANAKAALGNIEAALENLKNADPIDTDKVKELENTKEELTTIIATLEAELKAEVLIDYVTTKKVLDDKGKEVVDKSTLASLKKLVYLGSQMADDALASATALEELEIGFIGTEADRTLAALFNGPSATLRKVTLTKDTMIPAAAFKNFAALEEVVLVNEFTSIEDHAFQNCIKLETVKLASDENKGVILPASVQTVKEAAFSGCSSLVKVIFNEGVTEVAEDLFKACASLVDVTLSDTITTINSGAFNGCSNLKTLKIGKNLETIASDVFTATSLFESLEIDSENPNYVFKDHALLSKDETILHSYFASGNDSTEYTISDTVKVIGEYAFAACTNLTKVTFGANVEKVEESAFQMCTNLVEVVFNENLKEIGVNAFRSCTSLAYTLLDENIDLVEDNAFRNCPSLVLYVSNSKVEQWGNYYSEELPTEYNVLPLEENGFQYIVKDDKAIITRYVGKEAKVVIPNEIGGYTVTELGKKVFRNVQSLSEVEIAALNVTHISEQAFYNCGGLTKVTFALDSTVTHIEKSAFEKAATLNTVVLAASITDIAERAFYECGALELISVLNTETESATGLYLPEDLKVLGDEVFGSCLNLTKVVLPTSLEYIGAQVFNLCSSVVELSVPYLGVTATDETRTVVKLFSAGTIDLSQLKTVHITNSATLPISAFDSLAVETVVLGEGMTRIGRQAFSGCTKLVNVQLPSTLRNMGAGVFEQCTALVEITIPERVQAIQMGTFKNCRALEKINLPEGLSEIADEAFIGCIKLQKVSFGADMAVISAGAFSGCESLKTVELGGTAIIYSTAFENCISLESIYIPATVTEIGANAFDGCTSLSVIYVEASQEADAWEEGWNLIDSGKKEEAEVIFGYQK
ncbi:MAG: leucine-rich repeat protein [Bacilli bacterium]|nr:leucine-rich repeat protein [Bacilli bacterium]